MAKVVITIEDLEDDEIDLHMTFIPALDKNTITPAQQQAIVLLQSVRDEAEPGSFQMQMQPKE